MLSWLISRARRIAWLLLVVGIALHLTVRDGFDRLALCFYALPLPVLLVCAVGLLLTAKDQRGRRIAGGLCLLLLAWWSGHSWCWHTKPASDSRLPGEVRVLFWNLSRPPGPLKELAELAIKYDPDVIGCTEPTNKDKMPVIADWQAMLPDYSARPAYDELIWFTRGQPLMEKAIKLDGVGAYANMQLPINGKPVHFGFVDVWADPFHPRTQQVNEVLRQVQGDSGAIVMGDFNTPAQSAHFDAWRAAGFQDSFKEGGRGWRETWFFGLPILSLDHVWAGKDWRVIDCKKIWSLSSDHAALIVRLVPR